MRRMQGCGAVMPDIHRHFDEEISGVAYRKSTALYKIGPFLSRAFPDRLFYLISKGEYGTVTY